MSSSGVDVVVVFAIVEALLILLYAMPLPLSVIQSLNTLRPNFWLFLGSCVTAAVPLYEGLTAITKTDTTSGNGSETTVLLLNSTIVTYRSVLVFVLLAVFLIVQHLSTKLCETKVALEKMTLNRLATQKQAESASKQSLKMLDEIDALSKGSEPAVEKLTKENKDLKSKLKETIKQIDDLKAKVDYNEKEHASLIEQYSQLEKKLKPKENKKDK